MKNRRLSALILALCLLLSLLAGCAGEGDQTDTDEQPKDNISDDYTADGSGVRPSDESYFSDGDYKDVTAQPPDAEILLDGDAGEISDTTRGSSGSRVTISSKGVYHVTGQSDGVSIYIDDSAKSGNIYLILDNVTMSNGEACIYTESSDKVILQCVGECSLTSTDAAAIYAEDDLTINGSGSLSIVSGKQGVVCEDDLKITGASLSVVSATVGLSAADSLRIGGGSISIEAGHDGIQVDSEDEEGYFCMVGGQLTIDAGYDGIDVGSSRAESFTGYILLAGGDLDIAAGGGSDSSRTDTSQKGLKCDGDIWLGEAELTVSSADDAVHSGGSVTVTGGSQTLSTSDDGVCAEAAVSISGGELTVAKSYEGLEAGTVLISGGIVRVYASDDGVNAAGGSDSTSREDNSGAIIISGGQVYVNAGGDGLDSNGSIYISGGYIVIEGPSGGANGAIDKGDGADCTACITGGTVLALGCADMAVNFDSGSQCSALVGLSGGDGDTVTVDDGSGFSFTASKSFACAVYSSPALREGESYTLTAGSSSAALDFSAGLYYSDLSQAAMGTAPIGR